MIQFYKTKQQSDDKMKSSGFTSLQAALGFSIFGLVAAIAITPILNKPEQRLAEAPQGEQKYGIDRTVTGSISKAPTEPSSKKRYRVRQSILQANPSEPCIIHENGTQEGGC